MERKIDVIDDFNGRKIVFIHDIIFKKKQYVEWKDVKEYLKRYVGNDEEKHIRNAKFGWYRYDSYFAIPVHANDGEVDHYNVFHASLLIRHSEDGKKYLYDIIDTKKETSYPLEP